MINPNPPGETHISHAIWPKGTFDFLNNQTTDKHPTLAAAEAVCDLLREKGAGGDGRAFPLYTWVESRVGPNIYYTTISDPSGPARTRTNMDPALAQKALEALKEDYALIDCSFTAAVMRYERAEAVLGEERSRLTQRIAELEASYRQMRAERDHQQLMKNEIQELHDGMLKQKNEALDKCLAEVQRAVLKIQATEEREKKTLSEWLILADAQRDEMGSGLSADKQTEYVRIERSIWYKTKAEVAALQKELRVANWPRPHVPNDKELARKVHELKDWQNRGEYAESLARARGEQIDALKQELAAAKEEIAELKNSYNVTLYSRNEFATLTDGLRAKLARAERMETAHNSLCNGARRLIQASKSLGKIKGDKTLFELSPTKDAECCAAWFEFNAALSQTRDALAPAPIARADQVNLVHLGVLLIAEERRWQVEKHGWTAAHDDKHDRGQMLAAAMCYASVPLLRLTFKPNNAESEITEVMATKWPWDEQWWKPSRDPVSNLVKAGALIAAEIDRLTRAELDPRRFLERQVWGGAEL